MVKKRILFEVFLGSNDIRWVVEDNAYTEIDPFGFPFPKPYYWTKDGRYLYYTHVGRGDGCFAGSSIDFVRLDLLSGETMPIADGGSWMSISPDEKYLVTFNISERGPEIWDLETGAVEIFELMIRQEDVEREIDHREVVWAPDSRSLIYVIAAGVCDLERGLFNWVVRLDLDIRTQTILLARDERTLVPVAWIEADKVVVSDGTQMLWMDPLTGEVVPSK